MMVRRAAMSRTGAARAGSAGADVLAMDTMVRAARYYARAPLQLARGRPFHQVTSAQYGAAVVGRPLVVGYGAAWPSASGGQPSGIGLLGPSCRARWRNRATSATVSTVAT